MIPADLTDSQALNRLASDAPPLDILVNNARVSRLLVPVPSGDSRTKVATISIRVAVSPRREAEACTRRSRCTGSSDSRVGKRVRLSGYRSTQPSGGSARGPGVESYGRELIDTPGAATIVKQLGNRKEVAEAVAL